ncbi:MAG TPA: hypothetical protein VJN29_02795 [Intrasporangium sp.]|uniref:DUF7144 family membrane protein n=1 Tax=Intrasporangium sp. TaxID=1925024 RepID=UPI002B45A581|nr:hypothetical protein [Intrasporangium sp.]HKX66127.1 hypothetical protein [Intrasporangium sp.]
MSTSSTSSTPSTSANTETRRGWGHGVVLFAGTLMLVLGILEFLRGLTALFENTLFVNTPDYIFALDVTTWGWLHLIWGVVLAAVGGAILAGRLVGRIVGLSIVTIAMVLNFVSLPIYPLWSVVMIALCIFIMWALCAEDSVD